MAELVDAKSNWFATIQVCQRNDYSGTARYHTGSNPVFGTIINNNFMNDKLLAVLIDSLSIEELEEIIEKKRKEQDRSDELDYWKQYEIRCTEWLKKRMYPPKRN